ncbi:MAG TPA: beta-galactosidase [Pilimelia sp.]|nr:beta-galactosidase [Pilimelia sp.]
MRWPKGIDGLCYGGDYNPEQWPEDVWREDVALMRAAGVNLVSLGVFAWARLEPAEGRYDFGWLDRVLDLLADGGVRAALATPTASPPPWFSLAHPEGLPVTRDGVRLSHGSRDTYCASAPSYRAASRRIAAELAGRYAGHPALAMWHVHNEYGTTCHCDLTAAAFRDWLRRRYGGLDGLNDAWTTSFWSQHYSDWAQVRPPLATQYLTNPAQALDFRRFTSDELLAAFTEQRDVLRAHTPDVPVTTNFVLGGWVPVDHARWAAEVDVVAIDHYPSEAGPGAEGQAALAGDLARGWAGGRPWLLMETAPNVLNTAGRMHPKEPGRLLRQSLGYVARGSRGAMFFQWRASRGGAEVYHSAMVPHAGPDSRVFREVVELGGALRRVAGADAGAVAARVAVAFDAPSWWALQATHLPSNDLDYADEVAAAHRALRAAGVTTDIVCPGAGEWDLSPYAVLVLPCLYLMSDTAAAAVRRFVAGGGHLVAGYLSGVADEHARVRLGGYPGALREVLGVRVEEFHPLAADAPVGLSTGGTGQRWSEDVGLAGAEAVLSYAGGALAGRPAVTRHRYGRGVAWYLSTRLDDGAYRDLLAEVAAGAGAPPVLADAPVGVEAVRRAGAGASWLFLLNHGAGPAVVPAEGVELLSGQRVVGAVTVPPGGTAVISET